MKNHFISAALLFSAFCAQVHAEAQYVSDEHFVPLRSGPGGEFRIVHRGIPSGTELTVQEVSDDGEYSRITTARGTEGWIRSQYLASGIPARKALTSSEARNNSLKQKLSETEQELSQFREDFQAVSEKLATTESQQNQTRGELTEIKRISANAISLDQDKKRLLEETEIQKSNIELLEAENRRLQDSAESDAFINGAFAVLLGVMITLVVPRLWPRKRSSSSWA
jgi:SH3 domain protein